MTREGKLLSVGFSNFIKADQDHLIAIESAQPGVDASLQGFKDIPLPDRSQFPKIEPSIIGETNAESILDALWVSLLWWDNSNVLAIPKSGDFEDKAEWLYKRLVRLIGRKGGRTASLEETKEGIAKYFDQELKDVAACGVHIFTGNPGIPRLSKIATGADLVILKLSMSYKTGRDYSESFLLESMTSDGAFMIHGYGRRFTGKMVVTDHRAPARGQTEVLEFVLDDPSQLPEYYANLGARYFIGSAEWNGAIRVKPYVYLTPGHPIPVPQSKEIVFPDEETVANAHRRKLEISPEFPIPFKSMVNLTRDWLMKDGGKKSATPVTLNGQVLILRDSDGTRFSMDVDSMTPEERADVFFWAASRGTPVPIPRLELTYKMNTPHDGSYDVVISTEGSMGHIVISTPKLTHSLVFDMKDGSFVANKLFIGNDKDTSRNYKGRFLPERLFPRKITTTHSPEEVAHVLSSILPSVVKSESAVVPCRRIDLFPLSRAGISFRNPSIDFVLCAQPTVITAMFQFLCGSSPGGKGQQYIVFSSSGIPSTHDSEDLFPILAACQMLPVRMTWENKANENITPVSARARYVGKYSIELVKAAAPLVFPDGQFTIPDDVRKMTAGDGTYTENFQVK